MNTKSLTLAALLSTVAFAAAAAGPTAGSIGNETVAQSVKTRAEVRAELIAAQKDGSFQAANQAYASSTTPFVSTLSRAEVRKEAVIASRAPQANIYDHVGG